MRGRAEVGRVEPGGRGRWGAVLLFAGLASQGCVSAADETPSEGGPGEEVPLDHSPTEPYDPSASAETSASSLCRGARVTEESLRAHPEGLRCPGPYSQAVILYAESVSDRSARSESSEPVSVRERTERPVGALSWLGDLRRGVCFCLLDEEASEATEDNEICARDERDGRVLVSVDGGCDGTEDGQVALREWHEREGRVSTKVRQPDGVDGESWLAEARESCTSLVRLEEATAVRLHIIRLDATGEADVTGEVEGTPSGGSP